MKKYKVTEKHGILKQYITLEPTHTGYFSSEWAHEFSLDEIKEWINSGWIEEIQGPEFTKDDMMSFANMCSTTYIKSVDTAYNMWISINKKS